MAFLNSKTKVLSKNSKAFNNIKGNTLYILQTQHYKAIIITHCKHYNSFLLSLLYLVIIRNNFLIMFPSAVI